VFWLQQELAFERPYTKVDMGGISYQTVGGGGYSKKNENPVV
jgi:hypothetical protein